MLTLDLNKIVDITYKDIKSNIVYTCIGFGQDPNNGSNYLIGISKDGKTIASALFRDIQFLSE